MLEYVFRGKFLYQGLFRYRVKVLFRVTVLFMTLLILTFPWEAAVLLQGQHWQLRFRPRMLLASSISWSFPRFLQMCLRRGPRGPLLRHRACIGPTAPRSPWPPPPRVRLPRRPTQLPLTLQSHRFGLVSLNSLLRPRE